MSVDSAGNSKPAPWPDEPIREGFGQTHPLFDATLFPSGFSVSVFLDSGSTTCYVSEQLLPYLQSYNATQPAKLGGIGGPGPRVSQEAIVTAQFRLPGGDFTPTWSVSCGVVPQDTFPGQIALGLSIFSTWGIHYVSLQSVQLSRFPGKPTLVAAGPATYCSIETAFTALTDSKPAVPPATITSLADNSTAIRWHRATPRNEHTQPWLDEIGQRFPRLFDERCRGKGRIAQTVHRIDTSDSPPVKIPPRRYSPSQVQAIRVFVKSHLGSVIQKSSSSWSFPLHLVPKKTPEPTEEIVWRICVDYRLLNDRTVKNAHPLPHAYDQVQQTAGYEYYCFLDMSNGFWHIDIHPDDRHKTAFSTPDGLYEFIKMPFGLCNAPATFQSLIREVLEPLGSHYGGLLDDVAVRANTIDHCYRYLLDVLEAFQDYGFVLNAAKSKLFVTDGIFLGFWISKEGVRADPEKVQAILDRPMPTTTTEIRGFVNMTGYLRSLIANFSKIAAPLTDQSVGSKNAKVDLTPASIAAWHQLRELVTTTPLVKVYQWDLPCTIETDASDDAVGSALFQPHDGRLHPVAYFSRKLTPTQRRYSAQERELLAIVLTLQHWKHWLEGAEITVLTDHESLKTLRTKSEPTLRLLRFLDQIENYSVRIHYRPGKANYLADYLSRPPKVLTVRAYATGKTMSDPIDLTDDAPEHTTKPSKSATLRPEQLSRIDLVAIMTWLQTGQNRPPRLSDDWIRQRFLILNHRLYMIQPSPNRAPGDPPGPFGKAILLEVVDYDVLLKRLRDAHESQGHGTIGVTVTAVSRQTWHPELLLAAHEVIRTCSQCQLLKAPDKTLPTLHPIVPAPPLTRWGIDHTSFEGQQILNAIEYSTGWLVSQLVNTTSFQDSLPLLSFVVAQFDAPREWISDNAGAFTGTGADAWHKAMGSTVRPTTPYRPRGNGRVERANGVLKSILGRIRLQFPADSLRALHHRAVLIYNRRVGPAGYSPFFLLYGTQPARDRPPQSFTAYEREPTETEQIDAQRDLARQHEGSLARDNVNSLKAVQAQARSYLQESKVLTRVFAPGDWVLRVRQRQHKNEPFYDGPWAIERCFDNNTYSLISPGGIQLLNRKYNGTNLFPAYVADGHPVRSFWYGSQRMLNQDRSRIAMNAGLK